MRQTKKQIVKKLSQIVGATPITVVANTEVRMNKTNNPFYGARKLATINGMAGFFYDKAVMKRLTKEGKPLSAWSKGDGWFNVLFDKQGRITPLVKHKTKNKVYLRMMMTQSNNIHYFYQGVEVPEEIIAPYIPERKHYENQGLDEPVSILTFDLDNVHAITIKGKTYAIR